MNNNAIRILAAVGVLAATIGFCLPIWFNQSGSTLPAYIMAAAGILLLIIFIVKPRGNHG